LLALSGTFTCLRLVWCGHTIRKKPLGPLGDDRHSLMLTSWLEKCCFFGCCKG
jgi:hypothetical protein